MVVILPYHRLVRGAVVVCEAANDNRPTAPAAPRPVGLETAAQRVPARSWLASLLPPRPVQDPARSADLILSCTSDTSSEVPR